MNTNKVETLNIGLILISLILAFIFPFELFLFSYAVLGPLHYCTEISWLHDKNYFVKNKIAIIPLIILVCLFVIIANLPNLSFSYFVLFAFLCISFAFLLTFFIVYSYKTRHSVFTFFTIGVLLFLFYQFTFIKMFFFYLLTSIVHIYIFTGIFMLSGNLKRKNLIEHFSFILFLLTPLICFLIPVIPHLTFDYFKGSFSFILGNLIIDNFNYFQVPYIPGDFFQNEWVIKVSRFISFAYTYHYLNWFSKTNIIGWHNVSKKRIFLIISIWLISLISYAYNYIFGYQLLIFLSLLHVFLEFPLNWISILTLLKIKTH